MMGLVQVLEQDVLKCLAAFLVFLHGFFGSLDFGVSGAIYGGVRKRSIEVAGMKILEVIRKQIILIAA